MLDPKDVPLENGEELKLGAEEKLLDDIELKLGTEEKLLDDVVLKAPKEGAKELDEEEVMPEKLPSPVLEVKPGKLVLEELNDPQPVLLLFDHRFPAGAPNEEEEKAENGVLDEIKEVGVLALVGKKLVEGKFPNPVPGRGLTKLLKVLEPPKKLVLEPIKVFGKPIEAFENESAKEGVTGNKTAPLFFGINVMKINKINMHLIYIHSLFIITKILHQIKIVFF